MKTNLLIAAILILAGAHLYHARTVHAQTPVAYTMQGGGPHTTCTAPIPNVSQTCIASDGLYQSDNGGAYWRVIQLTTTAGVLTVNNKKPDATGNVSLAASTTSSTTLQ